MTTHDLALADFTIIHTIFDNENIMASISEGYISLLPQTRSLSESHEKGGRKTTPPQSLTTSSKTTRVPQLHIPEGAPSSPTTPPAQPNSPRSQAANVVLQPFSCKGNFVIEEAKANLELKVETGIEIQLSPKVSLQTRSITHVSIRKFPTF